MAETLVQFLEEASRKFGPRTALLLKPGFRYRRWSFAELWHQAGQSANGGARETWPVCCRAPDGALA